MPRKRRSRPREYADCRRQRDTLIKALRVYGGLSLSELAGLLGGVAPTTIASILRRTPCDGDVQRIAMSRGWKAIDGLVVNQDPGPEDDDVIPDGPTLDFSDARPVRRLII